MSIDSWMVVWHQAIINQKIRAVIMVDFWAVLHHVLLKENVVEITVRKHQILVFEINSKVKVNKYIIQTDKFT